MKAAELKPGDTITAVTLHLRDGAVEHRTDGLPCRVVSLSDIPCSPPMWLVDVDGTRGSLLVDEHDDFEVERSPV